VNSTFQPSLPTLWTQLEKLIRTPWNRTDTIGPNVNHPLRPPRQIAHELLWPLSPRARPHLGPATISEPPAVFSPTQALALRPAGVESTYRGTISKNLTGTTCFHLYTVSEEGKFGRVPEESYLLPSRALTSRTLSRSLTGILGSIKSLLNCEDKLYNSSSRMPARSPDCFVHYIIYIAGTVI